jgi:hypothetical protein
MNFVREKAYTAYLESDCGLLRLLNVAAILTDVCMHEVQSMSLQRSQ